MTKDATTTKRERWDAAVKAFDAALAHAGLEDYGDDINALRNGVFGLPDRNARRAVMRACKASTDACYDYEAEECARLRRVVAGSHKRKIRSSYAWGAVAFTVALVLGAYAAWGMIGALLAAAISVPINIRHLQKANERADSEIAEATALLVDAKRSLSRMLADDGPFTWRDMDTGEPERAT